MHQQPPPLPPPAQAQRLGGPVDASEGFGGALINVDQGWIHQSSLSDFMSEFLPDFIKFNWIANFTG